MQPDARDIDLTTIKLGFEGIARGCGCPFPAAMAVSVLVLHHCVLQTEAILFMLCNHPSSLRFMSSLSAVSLWVKPYATILSQHHQSPQIIGPYPFS